jgi:putative nucleotidyltransferase with HDIG domain
MRTQQIVADLETKVRQLSTLLEVSRVINSDLGDQSILHTVLEQAMTVLRAEAGTLWIVDGDGAGIEAKMALGPVAPSILRVRLTPGEGVVGQVIQTGVGDLVSDAQNDPRWAGRVDAETGFITRSLVSAPLLGRAGRIGCLQLINKADGALFGQSDLELLVALSTQAALVIENADLMERMRSLARDLQAAWRGTLDALASALATRDYETEAHCQRTVEMTILLARRMGVPEAELPAMVRGALLHDIGKIGIPDSILFKTGPLTFDEREIVKQHVVLGYNMLHHIPFFGDAMPVVLHHHESFDGSGFPNGLKGSDIPLGARIFHVVDVYDALVSERPYKRAWSADRAVAELHQGAGRGYDPLAVTALEAVGPSEMAWLMNLRDFQPGTRDLLGRA